MLQLFPVLNYQLKNKRELTRHEYRHEWRKVIEYDDVMGVVRPVLVAQVVAFIASVLLFSGKIAIGYLAINMAEPFDARVRQIISSFRDDPAGFLSFAVLTFSVCVFFWFYLKKDFVTKFALRKAILRDTCANRASYSRRAIMSSNASTVNFAVQCAIAVLAATLLVSSLFRLELSTTLMALVVYAISVVHIWSLFRIKDDEKTACGCKVKCCCAILATIAVAIVLIAYVESFGDFLGGLQPIRNLCLTIAYLAESFWLVMFGIWYLLLFYEWRIPKQRVSCIKKKQKVDLQTINDADAGKKGTFRDWLEKDIEIMWIVAVALIPVLAVMIIESAQLLCVLIGLLYQLLNLVVQPVW